MEQKKTSCYQPTPTEQKLMEFKLRIDVTGERAGVPARVSTTMKGLKLLEQAFGSILKSQVAD